MAPVGSNAPVYWEKYWPIPANTTTAVTTINFQSFTGVEECPENYEPYQGAGQQVVSGVQLNCIYSQPNIDAIATTPTKNGNLEISVSGNPVKGDGAFALATENTGIAGTVTATVTDSGTGPLSAEICETNASGSCTDTPAASISVPFGVNATPTFTVFVGAASHIPASDGDRVFVTLYYNNTIVGQVNVAVQTN